MKPLLVTLAIIAIGIGLTAAIIKLYELIHSISVVSVFIGFIILEGSQYA